MACRIRVAVLVCCLLAATGRASAADGTQAAGPVSATGRASATGSASTATIPPIPVIPAIVTDDPPHAVPGEILVRYRRGVRAAERDALSRSRGARRLHRFRLIDVDHLSVAEPVDSALARLRSDPSVLYAEPNWIVHAFRIPNDPRFPEQYALENQGQTGGTPGADVSARRAWDIFTGDSTTLVGMIDSGIDYAHPDLAANVWTNPGEIPGNGIDDDGNGYVDDVHGYDFANNDGDPIDDNGHGTHTAGIVAGVGNNGVGVTGMAWRARLVAIKFLDSNGSGSIANAIAAIEYSVAVGCRITSNSWGGGTRSDALLDAIAAAGVSGQLFVAAAGNSHLDLDQTPSYPASYEVPSILSVAATDDRDSLASFSNYGANSVDIAAPGVTILSTYFGSRYALISGTSMACPMVAGAAALILGETPSIGPLDIKGLLLAGADHPPGIANRVRSGRLNAFRAVAIPDSIPPGAITDLNRGIVGSSSVELSWTATGDDGDVGRAASYDIRWSRNALSDSAFATATPIAATPDPSVAGTVEHFEVQGLPFATSLFIAVRARDEFGNAGPISNVVAVTTLGIPHIAVAPHAVAGAALTGGADSSQVLITNTGAGALDFTIPTPPVAYQSQQPYAPIPYAKGEGGPAGLAVTGHSGGPDGFGYRWIDSDTTAGPAFDWVDVTSIGTAVNLNGDDNISELIPIGFPFPFYGTQFDSLRICTNGYLTFTDDFALYANQPLPSTIAPRNGIMPFWDDLVFGAEHRAWVWGDASRLLIEFEGLGHFDIGGPFTFEVELRPDGEIRYRYLHLGTPTNSATVGIQDGGAQNALQVAFNTSYLHDSLAVKMVPIGQWVTAFPPSGRVRAGESRAIAIRFAPAGLSGGDYHADLRVESNDPDSSLIHVPVHLHVTGAPDLRVSPGALAFGDVYVGARPTRTLTVSNRGSDDLRVGAITVSDSALTPDTPSFSLAQLEHRAVVMTWAPADTGTLSGAIELLSNDPDTPRLQIPVTGRAIPAPSVATLPESLAAELRTGASVSRTLQVLNRGGGDYVFRAVALASPAGTAVTVDHQALPRTKDAVDSRPGRAALLAGGPDQFGYTFVDSRDAGGPAFRWEDVRGQGIAIPLSGDDAVSPPLTLGFDFPFYGESFRSLRVSTNGFVSFTSASAGFANAPLPSQADGVPENLLAAFWDDLVFPTTGLAWFASDSAHAVIQFEGVPRFGEAGRPNTFEIAIDAAGTIEYRYLDLEARSLSSATVGIQNGTRDDGLLVDFNAPYLADNLAVRFVRPPRWVTVTPDTGRIVPGGSADLAVTFHAAGLTGGGYDGHVELEGNDPLAPRLAIPARLRVEGVPLLDLDPIALDFGTVPIGTPRTLALGVINAGSDTLRIDKIASNDHGFSVFPDRLALAPFSRRDVEVTFAAAAHGVFAATLTLRTNDPASPERTIALEARGADPPAAALGDTALYFALAHGVGDRALTGDHGIVLRNTGGSELIYRAHALTGPFLTATTPPLDQEGPKDAPPPALIEPRSPVARGAATAATTAAAGSAGPGALGAGGPDAFGYRWTDSDEPNGPSFDWIDARAGGTQLPLSGDDQTSAPIALPFRFPFYDASFDSIRVCTNGFASFTSRFATFTHAPLPNAGAVVPENLLAAFWSDQDFRPTTGSATAFVSGDSTRFVIAFYDVPHLTVGGPYTYEIVLHRDGTIDYQYLSMGTRLSESTIGIQNADRSIGLQVAYNAAYVHDRLRVHISSLPLWIAVSPDSGALPPGGTDTLVVTLSAASYPDGDYQGSVRLDHNEPGAAPREVPVHLHIGLAAASIEVENPALAIEPPDLDAHLRVSVPGFDARGIDPSTVRLNESLAVRGDGAGSTASAARLAVPILDLLRYAQGAGVIPIELIGESPGETWLTARDTLKLARPAFTSPAGLRVYGTGGPTISIASDDVIDLKWSEPPGVTVSRWDVWLSPDAGRSWTPLGTALRDRTLRWVASSPADSAMIEIIGRAGATAVTALISDPFQLAPRDSANGGVPARFGLKLRSENPARNQAFLQLALPSGGAAEVTVFDVTGARVRRLTAGAPSPGFVPLRWDLRDDQGRAVRPGLYFVRASGRGGVATLRVAVLR